MKKKKLPPKAELEGTWEYRLLTHTKYTGHRVKRLASTTAPEIPFSGSIYPDTLGGSTWSRTAQSNIPTANGDNYVFGFWSLSGYNEETGSPYSQVFSDPNANVTLGPPGTWLLTARAWYFWDFG